jgi:hypothetical protein
VTFVASKVEGSGVHSIRLSDPDFNMLFDLTLTTTPVQRTIILPAAGTYSYVCSNSACGSGHFSMFGELTVGP